MLKHVLFVGMNDKDTKVQEIAKEDAVQMILQIVIDHGFMCTIYTEGIYGVYKHEDGSIVAEQSFRIDIAGPKRSAILPMIHEIRIRMNQECVMWECTGKPVKFVNAKYTE